MEAASGLPPAALVAGAGRVASEEEAARVRAMLERRRAGEPLQYVVGSWGFRHLDLLVDRRVLIPRPETELVVEVALEELARLRPLRPVPGGSLAAAGSPEAGGGDAGEGVMPAGHDVRGEEGGDAGEGDLFAVDGRDEGRHLVVVDLGTGSGAIALALASEHDDLLEVWATDVSAEALEVAQINRSRLDRRSGSRLRWAEGDWWDALPPELAGRVDLVVSNPPYVAPDDEVEPVVAAWEPPRALWSGPTGLEDTGRILDGAAHWLRRPGVVVLEVAPQRVGSTRALAEAAGMATRVVDDLAGRPRVLVGWFTAPSPL